MSEGEYEAIWYCSEILNDNENDRDNWKIVDNLIDKQQKIIKKQSYTNKKMRKKLKTVRKERNKLQKEIERIKSIDIHKLVEDAETGQLIHKDKIKELREIDNIDHLQFKIKELLGE